MIQLGDFFFFQGKILYFFITASLETIELFLLTFFICKDKKKPCVQEFKWEGLSNLSCKYISLSSLFVMVESLYKVKKNTIKKKSLIRLITLA